MYKKIIKEYKFDFLSIDDWKNILMDQNIVTDNVHEIIRIIYSLDNKQLNAQSIGDIIGKHYLRLNNEVGTAGHKIYNKYYKNKDLPDPILINENNKFRWWVLLFNGQDIRQYDNSLLCYWIIKSNMLEAIKELRLYSKGDFKEEKFENSSISYKEIIEMESDISQFTANIKKAIINVRIGQDKFKKNLLIKYNSRCALCGINIKSILKASHIKPWCESTIKEKGNINNGILLCANHDSLFDNNLISFNDDGKILINKNLSSDDIQKLNLNNQLKIDVNSEMKSFLQHHRNKFYKLNEKDTLR